MDDKNADDHQQYRVDLHKLEYETAATRYEDIFKAVWQNFSYMAVLAGAILTFGKDSLGATLAALLACVPLLLWYWATYEPLNRYGDHVEERLSKIEKSVNAEFKMNLCHYTGFRAMHLQDQNPDEIVRQARSYREYGIMILAAVLMAVTFLLPLLLDATMSAGSWLIGLGALLVTMVVFLVLLWRWLRNDLRVRWGIRLFILVLHAAFVFLLARWTLDTSSQAPPLSTRIELSGAGMTIKASGSPEAIREILLAAMNDREQVPSGRSSASSKALSGCTEILTRVQVLEGSIESLCADRVKTGVPGMPGGVEGVSR